jgi:hypothetical protein
MKNHQCFRHLRIIILNLSLLFASSPVFGQAPKAKKEITSKNKVAGYDLNELALPSEVKGVAKATGSIYYSPAVKGKVLMPVHFWGYFNKPGLHFIPIGSSLLEGVSYAGGPNPQAQLGNVRLMTDKDKGSIVNNFYDLEKGGSNEAALRLLKPGDMVFVEKDYWYENRSYYTGLIGVVATLLSSILLYRQVKKN